MVDVAFQRKDQRLIPLLHLIIYKATYYYIALGDKLSSQGLCLITPIVSYEALFLMYLKRESAPLDKKNKKNATKKYSNSLFFVPFLVLLHALFKVMQ